LGALFAGRLRYNVRRIAPAGASSIPQPGYFAGRVTVTTEAKLISALNEASIPGIGAALSKVGKVRRAELGAGSANIDIELGFPAASRLDEIRESLAAVVRTSADVATVEVNIEQSITAHGVQPNLKPLEGVRNIIAVASGKGGVGKSTTAVNLALAMAADGARVGILDADIYGPSQPLMLGLVGERPLSEDGQTMLPLSAHGLQVMSIGFLVDADQPMAWRGPMVTSALNQLLRQTRWDDLDYLIVDMPPGTGDIQLTLSQQVPVSGAVIVTTPQDIALLDARKGLQMFRKVSVPVLGIIENMSTHVCSNCGHEEAIFGSGGGESMAAEYEVELLGKLPLDRSIREQTDSGEPTVVTDPGGVHAASYHQTAQRMAARLAMRGKDYSHQFPKIVVEDS
jgi:ATP-binding protein involved in chromosome partitioning